MTQKVMTESVVLADICRALESSRIFFFRVNNIPVRGRSLGKWVPKGLPDIIVCHNGDFIALEVKRPSGFYKDRNRPQGLLRPEQQQWSDKLFANGGFYYLVTSVDDVRKQTGLIGF